MQDHSNCPQSYSSAAQYGPPRLSQAAADRGLAGSGLPCLCRWPFPAASEQVLHLHGSGFRLGGTISSPSLHRRSPTVPQSLQTAL